MRTTVVLESEHVEALEHARLILGRLYDAGLTIDEHGVKLHLVVENLDEIIARVDSERARRINHLNGLPSRDGYALNDPKLVTFDREREAGRIA